LIALNIYIIDIPIGIAKNKKLTTSLTFNHWHRKNILLILLSIGFYPQINLQVYGIIIFPNIPSAIYNMASGLTKTAGTFIRPQFCRPGLPRLSYICCFI
jgi:hypothetical protein